MAAVAVLSDSRGALALLKRALPNAGCTVQACRSPVALERALTSRPIDGIVLGTKAARKVDLAKHCLRFPEIPLFLYGVFRSDEAPQLIDLSDRYPIAAFLVEGVDDPVAAGTIGRQTVTARRRAELKGLAKALRLTEALQISTLDLVIGASGKRPSTSWLASRQSVSREHLSRQFGAGGAPNLKRVIDLVQVVAARDLLRNPGCPLSVTAKLLGFKAPTHLRAVVRRVVRLPIAELARAQNAELIRRFASFGARSRRD